MEADGLPPPVGLDARTTFERARAYFESAAYERCVSAFGELLAEGNAGLSGRRRSDARTYLAACWIARGQEERARAQFRQGILENRQMEPPDPVVFPQAVVDLFFQVRSSLMDALRRQQDEELRRSRRQAEAQRLRARLERERVLQLEQLASTETVVRRNERWMAWVPFGVGQFHNENEALGWVFLTTEAALAATAIVATSVELGLHSQANGGQEPLDNEDLSSALDAARKVGTVAWVSLIGVAALGILEANLSFESEFNLGQRRRPLPPQLRRSEDSSQLRLQFDAGAGRGWVGVGGRF